MFIRAMIFRGSDIDSNAAFIITQGFGQAEGGGAPPPIVERKVMYWLSVAGLLGGATQHHWLIKMGEWIL